MRRSLWSSKEKQILNMKQKLFISVLAVVVGLAMHGLSAQAQKPAGVKQSKTEGMLKEIKIDYKPFQGENSFIVSYSGKEKKEIDVIIVDAGTAVVALADVAAGREIEL